MFRKFLVVILAAGLLWACSRPVAQFAYSDQEYEVMDSIFFENISEKAETFFWDFGDGDTSYLESPAHHYLSSGNYEVTLKAVKGNKIDSLSKRILVRATDHCLVELETNMGTVVIELYEDTPLHRANFMELVEKGFYDGLLFHRIIDGFMIQGGDPKSKDSKPGLSLGSGGPGYTVPNEIEVGHVHIKGALAAARTGDSVNPERRSSGSQFFIVHGSKLNEKMLESFEARNGMHYSPEQRADYLKYGGTPFLDGQYTVFGRVISGFEVIDTIASIQKDVNDRPLENIEMKIRFID